MHYFKNDANSHGVTIFITIMKSLKQRSKNSMRYLAITNIDRYNYHMI